MATRHRAVGALEDDGSPDGSVWRVRDSNGGANGREQHLHMSEGQVLVLVPQTKTYTYYDTIPGQNQQITRT